MAPVLGPLGHDRACSLGPVYPSSQLGVSSSQNIPRGKGLSPDSCPRDWAWPGLSGRPSRPAVLSPSSFSPLRQLHRCRAPRLWSFSRAQPGGAIAPLCAVTCRGLQAGGYVAPQAALHPWGPHPSPSPGCSRPGDEDNTHLTSGGSRAAGHPKTGGNAGLSQLGEGTVLLATSGWRLRPGMAMVPGLGL